MKRLGLFTFLASMAFFSLPLDILRARVAASPDAASVHIKWVNYSTFTLTHDFGDTHPDDSNFIGLNSQQGTYKISSSRTPHAQEIYFTLNGQAYNDCVSFVAVKHTSDQSISHHEIIPEVHLKAHDKNSSSNPACEDLLVTNVGPQDFANSKIMFNWVDSSTIQPVGELPFLRGRINGLRTRQFGLFKKQGSSNDFKEEGATVKCDSHVLVASDPKTADFQVSTDQASGSCTDDYVTYSGVTIGNVANATKPPGTGDVVPPPSDGTTTERTCESFLGGEALSWMICPLLNTINAAINKFDNAIYSSLRLNEEDFDRNHPVSETGAKYYQIWSIMRYLAMGFVVIIALIMILSQAIGEGPFDAYSIKKIMPRLVLALVGISLSWDLMITAIQFVNDIGAGIRALIYAPFGGIAEVEKAFNFSGTESVISGGAAAIGIGKVAFGLGGMGLLSLALTAAIAAFIGFAVIIFREIIISLLVVSAPIAIIFGVLPKTDKAWKIWHETFSKGLLMFPLIMAFLASGRVLAYLNFTSTDSSLLKEIIGIIAYYSPYFLIPLTFKFAGGIIATIGGMAGERSKGIFEGQRAKRRAIRESRLKRASSGGLYETHTKRGRFGNAVSGLLLDTKDHATMYGSKYAGGAPLIGKGLRRRASNIGAKIQNAQVEESQKLFQWMHANGFDDKGFAAVTGQYRYKGNYLGAGGGTVMGAIAQAQEDGKLSRGAPTTYKDFMTLSNILRQSDDTTEVVGGGALAGAAGKLSSLHSDPEMTNASVMAAGAMGWAQHGFAEPEDLVKVHKSLVEGDSGRKFSKEAAQALITRAQVLGQDKRIDLKATYGIGYDANGNAFSVYDDPKRLKAMIKTFKRNDYIGAKSGAIKSLAFVDGDPNKGFREGGIMDIALHDPDPLIRQAVQDGILQGASTFDPSDPDSSATWKRLASEIPGLSARIAAADEAQLAMERRGAGAAGGGDHGGAETPGASTPSA